MNYEPYRFYPAAVCRIDYLRRCNCVFARDKVAPRSLSSRERTWLFLILLYVFRNLHHLFELQQRVLKVNFKTTWLLIFSLKIETMANSSSSIWRRDHLQAGNSLFPKVERFSLISLSRVPFSFRIFCPVPYVAFSRSARFACSFDFIYEPNGFASLCFQPLPPHLITSNGKLIGGLWITFIINSP